MSSRGRKNRKANRNSTRSRQLTASQGDRVDLPDAATEQPLPSSPAPEPRVRRTPSADDTAPEALSTLGWARPTGAGAVAASRRRSRARVWRRVTVGAVALGATAIVGVLAWVSTRPTPDVRAELVHSDRYQPPHDLLPDTSYVHSRIGPSGIVKVTHWIHTGQPVRAVELRVPEGVGLAPADLYVLHVVVAGDGVRVPVTQAVSPGGTTVVGLPPVRDLFVRYQLAGVLDYSGGSADQALARITALDVSTSRPLEQTTRAVTGVRMTALSCDPAGPAPATPCGRKGGRTWRAFLGPGEQGTDVMARIAAQR